MTKVICDPVGSLAPLLGGHMASSQDQPTTLARQKHLLGNPLLLQCFIEKSAIDLRAQT